MTPDDSRGSRSACDAVRVSVASLFREHQDELCRVAGGIVGSGDAEDVVMDVMIAILRRAPDDSSIVTASYLFGSVRQEARKVRRRRAYRRHRLVRWSELQDATRHASRDPASVIRIRQRAAALYEAVAVLPEGQRKAFEARYIQDLSLREAAERLEKTESAVERQASRARRRLRDLLRSWGIEPIDEIGGVAAKSAPD